jgi:hypothetical protein
MNAEMKCPNMNRIHQQLLLNYSVGVVVYCRGRGCWQFLWVAFLPYARERWCAACCLCFRFLFFLFFFVLCVSTVSLIYPPRRERNRSLISRPSGGVSFGLQHKYKHVTTEKPKKMYTKMLLAHHHPKNFKFSI